MHHSIKLLTQQTAVIVQPAGDDADQDGAHLAVLGDGDPGETVVPLHRHHVGNLTMHFRQLPSVHFVKLNHCNVG